MKDKRMVQEKLKNVKKDMEKAEDHSFSYLVGKRDVLEWVLDDP